MRKLKIAQVAPLWFSIPPKKYGGIEWIVYNLCEGLTKLGHKVTLFATGDSKVPCKLVATYPRSLIEDKISWYDHTYNLLNLSEAFKRASDFDIIHTHIDLWELYFPKLVKTPVVHTIHNPLYSTQRRDSRLFIFEKFKNNNFVTISNAQKRLSRVKLNATTIYNGIRIEEFKFNPKPEEHFIWCARIDKYKGIENAILAAKRANVKLILAGRLDPVRKEYFKKKIKPYLGREIKYIGEYSREEKSDFFGKAKALLYPIEWHEPFGLNIIESQACGTPAIAFDKGSAKEVIKNGKTGYVIPFKDRRGKINIDGLVKAIKNIDKIKREDCRRWVEENFTAEIMVRNYEKLYYRLLGKK
jgi:glycosyltransferase involved in cell wall biosynthesis